MPWALGFRPRGNDECDVPFESRPQCRAVIDLLELQWFGQQALLERTPDRPLDVSAHCIEPERVGVVPQHRALLLAVLTGEVQVSDFGAPGPLIGDFLGP